MNTYASGEGYKSEPALDKDGFAKVTLKKVESYETANNYIGIQLTFTIMDKRRRLPIDTKLTISSGRLIGANDILFRLGLPTTSEELLRDSEGYELHPFTAVEDNLSKIVDRDFRAKVQKLSNDSYAIIDGTLEPEHLAQPGNNDGLIL